MKQFNIILQRALTARERQKVLAPLSSYFNLVFLLKLRSSSTENQLQMFNMMTQDRRRKQFHRLLLALCFKGGWSPVLQKTLIEGVRLENLNFLVTAKR